MKKIGIGLLGFGTIGTGVIKTLRDNGRELSARLGIELCLVKTADIDLETDRGIKVDASMLTSDAASVIDDPEVDIVVELIGGTTAAAGLVNRALERGKPVVTANKALLAERGGEIFDLAEKNGTAVYFGASVGGGIPIIRALRHGMIANKVNYICGILNGTCNYILTSMEREDMNFGAALARAQEKGYAEADPALDIDGMDTAHKAAILASLASGSALPMDRIFVQGIRGFAESDLRYSLDLGYRVKLLAVVKRYDGEIEVRVQPALVPLGHVLASVSGVFNAVTVRSDPAGETLYYGRGAGEKPTASTVTADIADAARDLIAGCPAPSPVKAPSGKPPDVKPAEESGNRYYLRLSLMDKPGVLAGIASVLGKHGISIASVIQKESGSEFVPVVIVTHRTRAGDMDAALRNIDKLEETGAGTVRLIIEDLEQ
ncbi:MAG: homoserine dehydrogenase [Kiritimatiellia bacterium]